MKSPGHRRSRHFNIMLVTFAVAGFVAVLLAVHPLAGASHPSYHDWMGHHRHQDAGLAMCDVTHDVWLDRSSIHLTGWLDLDAAQEASWVKVERELEQALASLRDVCGELVAGGSPTAMPERLEAMESAMAAGADAIRAVRPAFTEFYGLLSEEQQNTIDAIEHRHRFDTP